MIERQKEKYGWEFLFLDDNIDAAAEAGRFGISADRAVTYKCDEEGTALNYEVIGEAVCSVRAARPLNADWKERIDEDVRKRGSGMLCFRYPLAAHGRTHGGENMLFPLNGNQAGLYMRLSRAHY